MTLRIICCLFCLLDMLTLGVTSASAQHVQHGARTGLSLLEGYPIADEVFTTRQRTVVPDAPTTTGTIYPCDISQYEPNGFGHWHYGPGLDAGKRLDLMPTTYTATSVTNAARLLNLFTITDIHITDEESPVQADFAGYHGGNSSAYSPVMILTTQVLDAAIQTINALHKQKPFDFGMSIGDDANGSQYNELRWFIDVMDGHDITPDSGDKDDPVSGPNNDYQDAFKAAGLDSSIPWYQTLGNHDHSWLGSYPVIDYFRKFYTGKDILLLGDFMADGPDVRTDYMGSIDGRTPDGDIFGVGPVAQFTIDDVLTTPTVLAADANRRPLSRSEWMNEFFTTTSNPPGHGFSQDNVTNDWASYSFEPKANLPLKVIVLDDTYSYDVATMDTEFDSGQGYLSQQRLDWLTGELDEGQADGKLMIIFAHIPVEIISYGATKPPVTSTALLTKLSAYPNLILWISGHRHRNVIAPRPSIDPNYTGKEYGFWEVETASLRDFPQEFRTFEILRNSDNTISILTTDVDPAVALGSLAAKSRSYAIAAQQIFNGTFYLPPTGAYNAELVKQLTPEMQEKIQHYGTPVELNAVSDFASYE